MFCLIHTEDCHYYYVYKYLEDGCIKRWFFVVLKGHALLSMHEEKVSTAQS